MRATSRERLPAEPLLHAYLDAGVPDFLALCRLPGPGGRFKAILTATASFLNDGFIDGAEPVELEAALLSFYEATVSPPPHPDRLRRRAGVVRHALGHLLRCPDPLPQRFRRCVAPDGPYHVAGLGPVFWSAVLQGIGPADHPGWTPAVEAGLRRLGMATWQPHEGPDATYAGLLDAYARLRSLAPKLTALHCEHFLSLVAVMPGRNLFAAAGGLDGGAAGIDFAATIRQERGREPLRGRLRERGQALADAQRLLEEGLSRRDGKLLGAAVTVADPDGSARAPLDWGKWGEALTLWVGRLWEADDPYSLLERFWGEDPIPGAGLWLPAAVLHLKDPQAYYPWNDLIRSAYAQLDDSADLAPAAERYRLFNEGAAWLRQRHQLHPLELPAMLASLAPASRDEERRGAARRFGGFCADTFRFLGELADNNRRDWMERQRQRYHFAVRGPLVELCRELAECYVEPVLRRRHGWKMETDARSGLALTSVCKNGYGRGDPYNTALWITFCGRDASGKRHGTQFFVRLDAAGLAYGLRLGAPTRPARQELRRRLLDGADALFHTLDERGAFECCRLFSSDHSSPLAPRADVPSRSERTTMESVSPVGPDDFRRWLAGKELAIARVLPPDAPLLADEDLVGDVFLTFDRLLPLYARAAAPDSPLAALRPAARFTAADFRKATHLGDDWLHRARGLLQLKRQLILQGVPGTGKTHVARCLARLLTGDDAAAVRLVQFHPAYSYEEFVEGIKVKSVEVGGRHDVTYPVEDGLLCSFAARAAEQPSRPHVLLIDEINRGNLPRIFGELLYLLEYREQEVSLPYSRRGFRLPGNLYLLGTMNAADRSVALIDQALRRRFSFLDMPPDAAVLRAWLSVYPPAAGPPFADRVVTLFERLNARLRADLGPQCQVGHSYFMLPHLDEPRLRAVWQHHVRPLLDEYTLTQPGRSLCYDVEELLNGDGPRRRRQPAASGLS